MSDKGYLKTTLEVSSFQTLPEDPEIDSVTWNKFGNNMASDGAACINCKFDHQIAPLALVANGAT